MKIKLGTLILCLTVIALLCIIYRLNTQLHFARSELDHAYMEIGESCEILGAMSTLIRLHYRETSPQKLEPRSAALYSFMIWQKRGTLESYIRQRYSSQKGIIGELARVLVKDILNLKNGKQFVDEYKSEILQELNQSELTAFENYLDDLLAIH